MTRASIANSEADAYGLATMPSGSPRINVSANGASRVIDWADVVRKQGIEYKQTVDTVYAREEVREEIRKDAILVKEYGWTIKWVIRGKASSKLKQMLQDAGIALEFR